MTSPRILQAQQIVAQIEAIIADSDLDKITVTLDSKLVPSGSRNGVILVGLPDLRSDNFATLAPSWTVNIIAGPPDNYLAAWDRIDTILEVLFQGELNIDTATPSNFPALTGAAIPAYTLNLNE